MSTLHLDKLLDPTSVVVIGASDRADSIGYSVTRNLLGTHYTGQIHLVNPRYKSVLGHPCLPDLKSIEETPDLAIISTPARLLKKILTQCAKKKIKVAMVMTGSKESQPLGALARSLGIRIIGPHSTGLIRPGIGLNVSYSQNNLIPGSLAIASQSTSLGTAMLDWAQTNNIGFSGVILTGGDTDICLADIIDLLAEDPSTKAIIVYVERVGGTRSFLSALSAAARLKPVVLMRSTKEGARYCDVLTRSGQVFSSDNVFQTALNRAGVVRIRTFQNLFAAAKILSSGARVKGNRLAIVSNGAAPSMMAIERLDVKHFQLPRLLEENLISIKKTLGESASGSNPFVLRKPENLPALYSQAIEQLQSFPNIDAVLVIFVPDSRNNAADITNAVLKLPKSKTPILACWMGDASVKDARETLSEAGIPSFRTPEAAVDGFDFLNRYFVSQQQLLQLPNPTASNTRADANAARTLVSDAIDNGQRLLDVESTQTLMALFDIPMQPSQIKQTATAGIQQQDRQLIVSIVRDATFGPTLSVGIGGQLAAVVTQRSVQLPPLNRFLIQELLQSRDIRNYMGWSGHTESKAFNDVAHILRRLSELACEVPDVFFLEIYPLVVTENGAVVSDVTVCLERSKIQKVYGHLSIHPYPRQWIRSIELKNGSPVQLRPIRPEDASGIKNLVKEMSPESRYFRFMHAINELSPQMLAQFTKLDYDRQMAFVAVDPLDEVIGVSRYVISNDRLFGEFAISISENWKSQGLASALMKLLLKHARSQGLESLQGDVLMTNTPMQALMKSLGFTSRPDSEDPEVLRFQFSLTETL